MSTLNVDKVDPNTGTALEIGSSGDTITVPTGAGLTVVDEVKTNKVSPATGTAFALGDSGDTFTVPSGATIVNSGTATGFGITAASFRPNVNPLVYNGDMAVAQRSTSVASITADSYNTVDRWQLEFDGSGNVGTWTQTQESLTSGDAHADGFSNSVKMDCTTADASLAAGDRMEFRQLFEGQDLQLIKKGTANAEKLTFSFWVKATKTGISIVEMYDLDNNRSCSQSYTVSVTNTWEKKLVNFPADTTGAYDNDNAASLRLIFWMAAGTSFSSGTLQTTWGTVVSANRAAGQVNHADSTSNNFEITGVQLEVGEYTSSDLPPFQHETYAENLLRCQRYYYKLKNDSGGASTCFWGNSMIDSTTTLKGAIRYPEMRAKPSAFETTGTATDYIIWSSGNTSTTCSAVPTFESHTSFSGRLLFTVSSGLTAGQAGAYRAASTDAYLAWSAEL